MSNHPDKFVEIDVRVWRGARPTVAQAEYLASLGVRSSLNLEWKQSDDRLWPLIVDVCRVPDLELLPSLLPSVADEHVVRCLRIIRRASPIIYVHCRSGENRTGVIVAAYRIIELSEQLDQVLGEFQIMGGLWQVPDAPYIRSLAARREFFLTSI